jgi:hypothetical protein
MFWNCYPEYYSTRVVRYIETYSSPPLKCLLAASTALVFYKIRFLSSSNTWSAFLYKAESSLCIKPRVYILCIKGNNSKT